MTNGEPVHPEPGEVMPDFSLPATDGRRINLSDYRGQNGLVLIFTGGAECGLCRHEVLTDLCHDPEEYARAGGQLIVILRCSPIEAELVRHRDSLSCPVLVDEDGQVHRQVGAQLPDGQYATAIFVTDRQGTVCLASRSSQGSLIPTRQTLLTCLRNAEVACVGAMTPE